MRIQCWFQHTAARRRLASSSKAFTAIEWVSTHSRPKAAGLTQTVRPIQLRGFNTQPPEGGWLVARIVLVDGIVSTHSRPKAAGA